MAFVHGKLSKVLVAQYDQSAFFNNVDMAWDVDTPESTVFGDSDRTYIAGLRNSTMSFTGFWSMTSGNAPDAVAPAALGAVAATLVSYGPDGLAQGDIVYSVQARYTNYSISAPVDGIVGITLDVQGTDRLARCFSVHDLTAVTSDGNGAAYKLAANTSSGGVGYMHVTAITLPATAQVAITVQDSATCTAGSWSDLVAFTAITCSTATSERVAVAGNVDQYVRSEWAFTGLTCAIETATFHVNFQPL